MDRGGRGGFGGGRPFQAQEPGNPTKIGEVMYPAEDNTLLCKSTVDRVPYFNKPATLESGGEIGKIDEILGPINDFYFSIQCIEGVKPKSLKEGTDVYIGQNFLLPLSRFTDPKPATRGGGRGGRGGGRGAPRGRGGPPGRGRGGPSDRGRFSRRPMGFRGRR